MGHQRRTPDLPGVAPLARRRRGAGRAGLRAALLIALGLSLGCRPDQRFASLGDLRTEGGEVILDCRVGYRTYGRLDASASNAVLVLPWFLGTTAELAGQIETGRLVDASRYLVIAVDPLGNGVSSSPSNSPLQPGRRFPRLTVGDMVESQHALVTRTLGLTRLRAVVGLSMGGMQALAWATSHPTLADGIVSIAGSPRTTEGDRRAWQARIADVAGRAAWRRALRALAEGHPRDALGQWRVDPVDYQRQAEAIARLDLSEPFAGSMARAAGRVRAKLLLVVSERDELVDPEPAAELGRLSGAEILVLPGRCGHDAPQCERPAVVARIDEFLAGLSSDRAARPGSSNVPLDPSDLERPGG